MTTIIILPDHTLVDRQAFVGLIFKNSAGT
jgi:hypothetical protein